MNNNSMLVQMQQEKMTQDVSPSLSLVLDDLAARFILTCPDEEFESFERLFFQIEVLENLKFILSYWRFFDFLLLRPRTGFISTTLSRATHPSLL